VQNKTHLKVFLPLVLIGALYFCICIPANMQGAKDVPMLSVFEVDEFAQYPNVIGMLQVGDTFYQTVRNFAVYHHYFYGYPFYFFSALSLLPLRIASGADFGSQVQLNMAWLRQLINVLPVIIAAGIFTYLQTRFKSTWQSILLFSFLLVIPAVFSNNFWWHPDSLGILFIALTFFFLDRDKLSFRLDFFLAAVACGIAIGLKYLGVFFAIPILVYLLLGIFRKKISLGKTALYAFCFLAVMLAAILISNPLLLLPIERGEIIRTQIEQFSQTTVGIIFQNPQVNLDFPDLVRSLLTPAGFFLFSVLGLAGIIKAIRQRKNWLVNVLILAFLPALVYVVVFQSPGRSHYLIPIAMPLFSAAILLLPDRLKLPGKNWKSIASGVLGILVLAQLFGYLAVDIQTFSGNLYKESQSRGIQLYQQVETSILPLLPQEKLVVYRDWEVYFPGSTHYKVQISWDLVDESYMRSLDPDLILLDYENVHAYSADTAVSLAVNPEMMARTHDFYLAASQDTLAGYCRVINNQLGTVLLKQAFCDKVE
jgi:hypothetical protein